MGSRLLLQSYEYPNLSGGADRVGGQLRGDKECPFSGVKRCLESVANPAGARGQHLRLNRFQDLYLVLLSQEAEGGIYEEIWHKMAGMPTVKSNSEAQQYVLQGTHAYMTDASQLEYIMLKDCTKYSVAKELFNTGGFGFVLHEDSPYMDVVNYK